MPVFSHKSRALLSGCDIRLQEICCRAIEVMDFAVITGHRTKAEQQKAVIEGKSKLKWPDGKHNTYPSLAVDIAPYPIDWHDVDRFLILAGIMKAIAHMSGVKLRWGGDWDGDLELREERFRDLGHFEII